MARNLPILKVLDEVAEEKRGPRKWLVAVAKIALSLACLSVVYITTDFRSVMAILARAGTGAFAVAFILTGLHVLPSVLRWKIVLAPMASALDFVTLLRASLVAQFFGLPLPSSAADIVRVAMIAGKGVGWGAATGSVLMDRLYGVLALGLVSLPGIAILAAKPGIPLIVVAATALPATISALIFLVVRFTPASQRSWEGSDFLSRSLARLFAATAFAQVALTGKRIVAECILLSLASQCLTILGVVAIGLSLHIVAPLWVYFAFTPLVWLVSAIPVTISGIGVREISFSALFATIGATHEQGVALGAMVSVITIGTSLLGGFALFYEGKPAPLETRAPG